MTEVGPTGGPPAAAAACSPRPTPVCCSMSFATRKELLDGLVPELRAMRDTRAAVPGCGTLEGESGMRAALFETLEWDCPLRGILSMHDLMAVPARRDG